LLLRQGLVTEATADEFVRKFFWNRYLAPRSKAIGWLLKGFQSHSTSTKDSINFVFLQVSAPYD
jgi:hypothetical protein